MYFYSNLLYYVLKLLYTTTTTLVLLHRLVAIHQLKEVGSELTGVQCMCGQARQAQCSTTYMIHVLVDMSAKTARARVSFSPQLESIHTVVKVVVNSCYLL